MSSSGREAPTNPNATSPKRGRRYLSVSGWRERFSRSLSPAPSPPPTPKPSGSISSLASAEEPAATPSPPSSSANLPGRVSSAEPTLASSPSASPATSTPLPAPERPNFPIHIRTTSLWEKAIQSLPQEDRNAFDFHDPDGLKILDAVLKATEEKRNICQEKMWKFPWEGKEIVLRDVADKTITWVNKFKALGNMAAQCDPTHLAIPWAPVRYLLEIAVKDSQKMGEMLVGIEAITNLMGRCAIYEELYLGSGLDTANRVEAQLISLYAKILSYLITAKSYYAQNTAARIMWSVLDESGPLEDLKGINEQAEQVRADTDLAEAKHQMNRSEGVMKLLKEFNKPIVRIEQDLDVLRDGLEDTKRKEVLNWISKVAYTSYHRTAIDRRKEGTCEWLLQKPEFHEWEMSSASNILWLRGDPGAGKTTLISTVVETALRRREIPGNREALAYFYCKHGETQLSNPAEILRSIVRQLSFKSTGQDLQKPVTVAYENATGKALDDALGIQQCVKLIIELINLNLHTTIVIDALDECDNTMRDKLFRGLREIVDTSTSLVKIFISSRDDDDIRLEFAGEPKISIEMKDNSTDIEYYIHTEIGRLIKEKKLLRGIVSDQLKELVISKLLKKAGGMFLWVQLQIEGLCDLDIEEDVKDMLGNLPATLKETYQAIYNRISSGKGRSPEIAKKALMWVICSCQPLSPEELSIMVSLQSSCSVVKMDVLLKICHNLLKVDEQLNVVRFFHLSVEEFLEKEPYFTVLEANTMAAEFCLSRLACLPALTSSQPVEEYPVLHWPTHIQRCSDQNTDHIVWKMLNNFFGPFNTPSSAYTCWFWRADGLNRRKDWREKEGIPLLGYHFPDRFTISDDAGSRSSNASNSSLPPCEQSSSHLAPPMVAVFFGFGEKIKNLWEEKTLNINLKNASDESLLYCAASGGHEKVVQMLLEKGAEVNAQGGSFGNALQAAAFGGHEKVVQMLLEKGAEVNAQGGSFGNALQAAASGGHEKVVQMLLEKGAEVNAQGGSFGNGLQAAASGGHEKVVQMLLEKGAEVNAQGSRFRNALQAAAFRGHEKVVQMLLEKGAEVNAQGGHFGNALQAAASGGHEKVVQMLLEKGAEANAQGGRFRNALQAAASGGHEKVVQMLLEKGAEVNAQGGSFGNALQAAASGGHEKVVQMLLEKGAEVNVQGGHFGNALQAAAFRGREKVVQMLLEKRAEVNAQGGHFGNALQAAASRGREKVVQMLLEKGAISDKPESAHQNPPSPLKQSRKT